MEMLLQLVRPRETAQLTACADHGNMMVNSRIIVTKPLTSLISTVTQRGECPHVIYFNCIVPL